MKILIDIPDTLYERYKELGATGQILTITENAICNGKPLPKGHGDLIDRSKIYKAIPAEEDNGIGMGMSIGEMDAYNDGIDAMYSLVKGSPAIIEADKEDADEDSN